MQKYNLTGKRFGMLTVVKEATNKKGRRRWLCKCDCGGELDSLQGSLVHGRTVTCGCRKKLLGNNNANWTGYECITGSQWALMRNNARHRNLVFDIKIEQAWELFTKQNGKCALSGVQLTFSKSYNRELAYSERTETTASLDRIDSSIGYVVGNLQWVHKHINLMKGSLSTEDFIKYCRLVASK